MSIVKHFFDCSFLRFVNWQLAALRQVDPTTLLTVGSWSEKAQNSAFSGSRKELNYITKIL